MITTTKICSAVSYFHLVSLLSLFAAPITAAGAEPDSSAAGLPSERTESGRIEEIVVRARKREESAQDVAAAVTAIRGETLDNLRAEDVRDLVQRIPGLQIQSAFGMSNPAIFMRGVGVNDFSSIAGGTIGFYVDDVYIASPAGQLFQFLDLERVEVLRGPQGTLYGRNTTAGAVNIVSRDPGRDLDSYVRASYGRFDAYALAAALGGALSESVSTRLAFVTNKRDGYVDNLTLGTQDSDVDNWAARASLKFQPSEAVEWLFRLHLGRSNAGSKRNKSQGLLDPESVAAGAPALCASPEQLGTCSDPLGYVDNSDPYSGNWNRRGGEDVDYSIVSAALEWHLPGFTLSSITAYNDTGRFVAHDADASPNQLLEIDWQDDSEQWSQELRLSSRQQEKINWIAGLYYFDRRVAMTQVNDAQRGLRPILGFNPMLGVFTVRTDFDAEISAYAAFGELDFDLSDKVTATAGLRYTSETHKIDRFDRIEEPGFVIGLVDLDDRVEFDDISGKLGVDYKTNSGNLFYGSISKGYKSGGFNGSVAIDPEAIPPFDEETVRSYEAGFKWTSPEGRLRLNTAGFYSDYRDLQVFTRVNTGGIPREVLTNAADARVLGLEIELTARTGRGWNLQLGIGLLDTELEDFQTFGGRDFSGNELVYAPDTTVSGLIQREWQTRYGRLAIQADFHYQDDVFFDTSNNPLLAEDSYSRWNARIAYRTPSEQWEFALWGKNLGDTEYKLVVIELADFGFNNVTFGEPRMWGVDVQWRL